MIISWDGNEGASTSREGREPGSKILMSNKTDVLPPVWSLFFPLNYKSKRFSGRGLRRGTTISELVTSLLCISYIATFKRSKFSFFWDFSLYEVQND